MTCGSEDAIEVREFGATTCPSFRIRICFLERPDFTSMLGDEIPNIGVEVWVAAAPHDPSTMSISMSDEQEAGAFVTCILPSDMCYLPALGITST
jgi:hypothetical protein